MRDATPADLAAITAIYAHHVLLGTGTFEETPPDAEELAGRLAAVTARGLPWLVAEQDGAVQGYAYLTPFRDRSAYRFTVENAVYVRDDIRGQGVGKLLVAALIERAEGLGLRQMFAVIGDGENAGSIGLHASLGFRQVGVMRGAGIKFGRWLDVVIMQRMVGAGDRDIPG